MPYELHFSYVNLSQNVLPFVLRDRTTEMGNSFIEQLHESLVVLTPFLLTVHMRRNTWLELGLL